MEDQQPKVMWRLNYESKIELLDASEINTVKDLKTAIQSKYNLEEITSLHFVQFQHDVIKLEGEQDVATKTIASLNLESSLGVTILINLEEQLKGAKTLVSAKKSSKTESKDAKEEEMTLKEAVSIFTNKKLSKQSKTKALKEIDANISTLVTDKTLLSKLTKEDLVELLKRDSLDISEGALLEGVLTWAELNGSKSKESKESKSASLWTVVDSHNRSMKLDVISRYNEEYYCQLSEVMISEKAAEIKLRYSVHCRGTFGAIQDPTYSTLYLPTKTPMTATSATREVDDPYSNVAGWLTYGGLSSESFKPGTKVSFQFGSSGYNTVDIFTMPEKIVPREPVSDRLKESIKDLLPYIRFPLFSLQEFALLVAKHNLLPAGEALQLMQYISTRDIKSDKSPSLPDGFPYSATPRKAGEGGGALFTWDPTTDTSSRYDFEEKNRLIKKVRETGWIHTIHALQPLDLEKPWTCAMEVHGSGDYDVGVTSRFTDSGWLRSRSKGSDKVWFLSITPSSGSDVVIFRWESKNRQLTITHYQNRSQFNTRVHSIPASAVAGIPLYVSAALRTEGYARFIPVPLWAKQAS